MHGRMERVEFGRWTSKVKIVGVTLCVGGALTTSFYKGKEFYIGLSSHHIHTTTLHSSKTNMLRGTLFLLGSCFSYTTWFIVQVCLCLSFLLIIIFSLSKIYNWSLFHIYICVTLSLYKAHVLLKFLIFFYLNRLSYLKYFHLNIGEQCLRAL